MADGWDDAKKILDLLRETGNTVGSAKRTLEHAIKLLEYEKLAPKKEEK